MMRAVKFTRNTTGSLSRIKSKVSSFNPEPQSLSPDAQSERKGGGGSRQDSPPIHFFQGSVVPISDIVAQVGGITGRSSPSPERWGRRPRRSVGTGEDQPSSLATVDAESYIKAPSSTSEPVRVSEVLWGSVTSSHMNICSVYHRIFAFFPDIS